ncbi:MAG TPA: arginine deiminase-related protein [Chitinophagaceae bacterium]|nr:arginine deiminase-related protein [Chitinophagaceae bacterium]
MQITDTILMVRPAAFGPNGETAATNFFQSPTRKLNDQSLQQSALKEFDNMVELLQKNDINVLVIDDTPTPIKPSAIFPNNWLSTSPEGIVSVFPMYAANRRPEKRDDILKLLAEKFVVKDLQDWSEFEVEGKFLEGTGSMVIDHENKVIYTCYSPRTDVSMLEKFANANNYRAIIFLAVDKNGQPVYHTNVMMTLGEDFAILCEEAIEEEWELIAVRQLLESTAHDVIRISKEQMHAFAGNMLQVKNNNGEKFIVMSQTAFDSLNEDQKEELSARSKLLLIPIPIIEETEGGSVRCMMAEIFLSKKN